jgi:hypothetical protein
MANGRAAEFRAAAAECLMLASTSTDRIVREEQLARAEAFLRLAEKHERTTASPAQPAAQQQQQIQPKEPGKDK